MIEAAFDVANRLFGLEFRPLDGPLYHPDVRAWEVTRDGRHMAVFIGDYFARGSKRSGAWCSTMRRQKTLGGETRPVVVNVCNFARPAAGTPALLGVGRRAHAVSRIRPRAAQHPVGRDLRLDRRHLGGARFRRTAVASSSNTGSRCPRCSTAFATHAETGDGACPTICATGSSAPRRYDMGFQTVEYLASALVDLAFHAARPRPTRCRNRPRYWKKSACRARSGCATPRRISPMSSPATAIPSGYYSYMWSEVMDADAFAAFEEAGEPFDPETAARLETLRPLGRQHPGRGRRPISRSAARCPGSRRCCGPGPRCRRLSRRPAVPAALSAGRRCRPTPWSAGARSISSPAPCASAEHHTEWRLCCPSCGRRYRVIDDQGYWKTLYQCDALDGA